MPPPCGIWGASFFSSGISETRASVVSRSDAIDEAFCNALRTTLAGSMTPAFTKSSYTSVAALKRHAAARHDAFLDRRFRRVHRVLDARFLLLHLRLGGRTDLDDRDATHQ